MGDLIVEVNSAIATPFVEYRGLQLELNFEGENTVNIIGGSEVIQGELSSTQFTFTNEVADYLNSLRQPGSLGVFWGVPLKIKADNLIVLDSFIDLTKSPQFECNKVTAGITERKQKDWLNDIADGFDYKYLEFLGIISTSDFIKRAYIISSIPNYEQALILSLTGFVIFIELQRTVKDLADILSDLSGVFSTIAGVLKLIYFIVYLGLLIFALVKLIKELIFLFIQPIKYHYSMSALKHWETACAHLGLSFSSSYYQDNVPTNSVDINGDPIPSGIWKNSDWMPAKSQVGAFKNGTPKEKGYFKSSFGDWIRTEITLKNAKVFIIDNTLHLERKDFRSSSTSYKIPDVKHEVSGINSDELFATTFFEFQVDTLDTNTVTNIDGNNVKAVVSAINKGVSGTELHKGLIEHRPNCARGIRKDSLTEIEFGLQQLFINLQPIINVLYAIASTVISIVGAVVHAINKVIGAINSLPGVKLKKLNVPNANFGKLNIAAKITDRIGYVSLSSDATGQPKYMLFEGSGNNVKIPTTAEDTLSAENIYNKYYFINNLVPSLGKPLGNQWYIYKITGVPFCTEDYELIRGLSGKKDGEAQIISPEGDPAKIRSILWNPWTNLADITYLVNKVYDSNIQLTLTKDTGQ